MSIHKIKCIFGFHDWKILFYGEDHWYNDKKRVECRLCKKQKNLKAPDTLYRIKSIPYSIHNNEERIKNLENEIKDLKKRLDYLENPICDHIYEAYNHSAHLFSSARAKCRKCGFVP